MSWIRDFILYAVAGVLCFVFLPFLLSGLGVKDFGISLFLGFSSCIILWLFVLPRWENRGLSQNYYEWKKTASKMGLDELRNNNAPQVVGFYRNHHVKILGDPYSGVVSEYDHTPQNTLYIVEFVNPRAVLMYIIKSFSLAVIFHGNASFESYNIEKNVKDTKVGDPEFDHRFVVKSNIDNNVKTILDQSIQKKILAINDFYELVIGFTSFLLRENGELSPTEMERDEAHYSDTRTLNRTKQDAARFRAIIDTLIDIVEKIEAYTPSV